MLDYSYYYCYCYYWHFFDLAEARWQLRTTCFVFAIPIHVAKFVSSLRPIIFDVGSDRGCHRKMNHTIVVWKQFYYFCCLENGKRYKNFGWIFKNLQLCIYIICYLSYLSIEKSTIIIFVFDISRLDDLQT